MKQRKPSIDLTRLAEGLKQDLEGLAGGAPNRKKKRAPFANLMTAVRAVEEQAREVQQEVLTRRSKHVAARAEVLAGPLAARRQEIEDRVERRQAESAEPVDGRFVVAGRVVDVESGTGLAGARVRVLERDPLQDDLLGEVLTDNLGFYRQEYGLADFEDLFERKPETYIQILDDEGNIVHSSDRCFRHVAGKVEILHAAVDGRRFPLSMARGEEQELRAAADIREVELDYNTLDARRAVREGLLTRRQPDAPPAVEPEISRIEGVGAVYKSRLEAQGLTKAAKVAAMPPGRLAKVLEVAESKAETIRKAAERLLHRGK